MDKGFTLQHTVVGLPVFSPQSLPEAWRLHSLITLVDCHLTAAVKTGLQWTPERNQRKTEQFLIGVDLLKVIVHIRIKTHCSLIVSAAVFATLRVCSCVLQPFHR